MPYPEYAELHCWSNFSFLEGASHPEELVEHGVALGLRGIALTDRDGLYGAVRFAKAAVPTPAAIVITNSVRPTGLTTCNGRPPMALFTSILVIAGISFLL